MTGRLLFLAPAIAAFSLLLLSLVGCQRDQPKTRPVSGAVELATGDVALLKGSNVELVQESDSTVRASGVIGDGGRFQIKTFHNGSFLGGALEGNYKARIILADESDEGIPKRPPNLVPRRYLDFETSGLKLSVPSGDYNLKLSK